MRRGRVDVAMGWIHGSDAGMDLREPCPPLRPCVTPSSYLVGFRRPRNHALRRLRWLDSAIFPLPSGMKHRVPPEVVQGRRREEPIPHDDDRKFLIWFAMDLSRTPLTWRAIVDKIRPAVYRGVCPW